MSTYQVKVPFQDDMGTISPFVATDSSVETKEQNALWTLNNMRDHDGLPHLDEVPDGTQFILKAE